MFPDGFWQCGHFYEKRKISAQEYDTIVIRLFSDNFRGPKCMKS